jgi:mRNA interferase RelE/StbE
MFDVQYDKAFTKDMKALPSKGIGVAVRAYNLIMVEIPAANDLTAFNIVKLRCCGKYRVKIANVRAVFSMEGNVITFHRILDRKDIYKYFE